MDSEKETERWKTIMGLWFCNLDDCAVLCVGKKRNGIEEEWEWIRMVALACQILCR